MNEVLPEILTYGFLHVSKSEEKNNLYRKFLPHYENRDILRTTVIRIPVHGVVSIPHRKSLNYRKHHMNYLSLTGCYMLGCIFRNKISK